MSETAEFPKLEKDAVDLKPVPGKEDPENDGDVDDVDDVDDENPAEETAGTEKKKKKKKKKSNKKKAPASQGSSGSLLPHSRLLSGFTDYYLKYGQTLEPSIPVRPILSSSLSAGYII